MENMKTVKPEEMMHIPLEMITPSDKNPRTIFDEERIAELANSMSALGQLQPIMLRETEDGYTIIVGGRRFMAAQKLGWKTIQATIMPAACVKKLDEADMLFIRLEENLKREALSPLEQAKAFAEAKKLGRSVEDIASRLSLSTRTVYNTIRLLSLSDAMQEMLAAGRITPAHCDRLLRIENEDERQEVFEAVIHEDMSVRRMDEFIGMRAPDETDEIEQQDTEEEEVEQDEDQRADRLKEFDAQQAEEKKKRDEESDARELAWKKREAKQEAAIATERDLRVKAMSYVVQQISESCDSGAVHELAGHVQRQIGTFLRRTHDDSKKIVGKLIDIDFETSENAINTKISCLPFQKMVAVLVVLEAAEYLVPMYWELDSNDQFGEDRRIEIFDTLLSRFSVNCEIVKNKEQ